MPARIAAPRALAAIIALPAVAIALLFAVNAAATGAGIEIVWPVEDVSLAEALVHRNTGEAVLQISRGADVDTPSRLVRRSPAGRPIVITPLEAAVLSGELGLVRLLLDRGARLDDENLPMLECLADRIGEQAIAEFLAAQDERSVDCDAVRAPSHIFR